MEGADVYKHVLKNMSVALSIVREALSGKYANFAVMEVYGDTSCAQLKAMAVRVRPPPRPVA